MTNTHRKAITIFDEDTAMTLVKPFSDEYWNQLFVIYEDVYGEAVATLTSIDEIRMKFSGNDEEFQEILNQL
jgi:hypothetical protein